MSARSSAKMVNPFKEGNPTTKKQQVNPFKKVNPSKPTREPPPDKYRANSYWKAQKSKARHLVTRDENTELFTLAPETEPVLKPVLVSDKLIEDLSDKLNEMERIEKMGRWLCETFYLEDVESEGDEP